MSSSGRPTAKVRRCPQRRSPEEEVKVSLGPAFHEHRELLLRTYRLAGSLTSPVEAKQQLLLPELRLDDAQLEEMAKLTVKATEEAHSHLGVLGQVQCERVAASLLHAYGQAYQHRLCSCLLPRIQTLQRRVQRSVVENFVTGFDEQFCRFLGHVADSVEFCRRDFTVYFLTVVTGFLDCRLASVDRWRRSVLPLYEFRRVVLAEADKSERVSELLAAIAKQLAPASADRFMQGPACTFVRPQLSELMAAMADRGLVEPQAVSS